MKNSPRKRHSHGWGPGQNSHLNETPISSSTCLEPFSSSGKGRPQNPELTFSFPPFSGATSSLSPPSPKCQFFTQIHTERAAAATGESTFTLLLMAREQQRHPDRRAMPGAQGESLVFWRGELGKAPAPCQKTQGREQSEHVVSARRSSISAGNTSPPPVICHGIRTRGQPGQDGSSTAPPPAPPLPFWWRSCGFRGRK